MIANEDDVDVVVVVKLGSWGVGDDDKPADANEEANEDKYYHRHQQYFNTKISTSLSTNSYQYNSLQRWIGHSVEDGARKETVHAIDPSA